MVRLITNIASLLVCLLLAGCSAAYVRHAYHGELRNAKTSPTIAVIGDLQRTSFLETWRERNDRQQKIQIFMLAKANPDLLITLGDNVFWGSSDDDWIYFDKLMAPIRKQKIPIMPVLGNHEYFGDDLDMYEQMEQRFPLYEGRWYSKIYDSIAFVMINSNFRDLGAVVMDTQRRWFVKTIRRYDARPDVKFIVVCGHHPPFSNSLIVEDDDILQAYFLPTFVFSRKGALWFSGHCHAYERFVKGGKQFVVSGGGGGPRQRLATGIFAQHEDEYPGTSLRPLHYCLLNRSNNTLRLEMVPLQYGEKYAGDTLLIPAYTE